MKSQKVKDFDQRIKDRSISIGIVGIGYVGLPLALTFARNGYKTTAYDVDNRKIEILRSGKSYLSHISDNEIKDISIGGQLTATNKIEMLSTCDAIIICVPTPLSKNLEPDLSYIEKAISEIVGLKGTNQFICLESTTYPSTTEDIVCRYWRDAGYTVGKDVFIGYSPEREDPGNTKYNTSTIPKIISGVTTECLAIAELLYSSIIDKVIPVSSPKVAEITKLVENIHRSVNIGLVNELKIVCDSLEIDIFEVINAAATKPFGFVPYYPGPGLGGHCIPIDPYYLSWKAKEFGIQTKFIELASDINTKMPNYIIKKISECLNTLKKPINGSNILILGLAYKKNIEDTRSSPSIIILEKILELGGKVQYSDSFVKNIEVNEKRIKLNSIEVTADTCKSNDLVVLLTDHDEFDYKLIYENSTLILDCRGRYAIDNKVSRG